MNAFKISFLYKEKTYLASVHRVGGNPVQYLVFVEKPNDLEISDPFVISANLKNDRIEYGLPDKDFNLGHKIALAVKEYCYDNGIPLLEN